MTYPTTLVESLALLDAKVEIASGDGTLIGNNQTFEQCDQMVFCCNTGSTVATDDLTINVYQSTATFQGLSSAQIDTAIAAGTIKLIADKTATPVSGGQAVINVKAEELDNAGGFVNLTYRAVGESDNEYGVTVFAGDASYGPASSLNAGSTIVVK